MISDIQTMPDSSIILLHACAHNPTGVDPTEEQWKEISLEIKKKQHVVLMDCAYQVPLILNNYYYKKCCMKHITQIYQE